MLTLKLKGYADPTKVFHIPKLLTATKSRLRPDIRLPITLPVLRLLVDTLKQTLSFVYSDVSGNLLPLFKSRRNYLQNYEFEKFSVIAPRSQFSPSQKESCSS